MVKAIRAVESIISVIAATVFACKAEWSAAAFFMAVAIWVDPEGRYPKWAEDEKGDSQ